jgi:hypothetical protein
LQPYEGKLLPLLNKIIHDGERDDIIVYVFQIYSAFVMNSQSETLDDTYATIAKSILESKYFDLSF